MTDPLDTIKIIVGYRGAKADVEAETGDASIEAQRFAYASDTDELGVWTDGAWVWIATSAAPTFGTPAIVLGTAAGAGAVDEVIRRDATIVAFDATAPTTQAFGDAAAAGVVAKAARRDHLHGMPAAPSGTSPSDTAGWQPVGDGTGGVLTDGATGAVIMAYGPF